MAHGFFISRQIYRYKSYITISMIDINLTTYLSIKHMLKKNIYVYPIGYWFFFSGESRLMRLLSLA